MKHIKIGRHILKTKNTSKTKICNDNKPLAAVVCGFERGGTTLLSEILRQHPKLDSGFEGGFLLTDNVVNFLKVEPYCTYLKAGWKVNDDELKYICSANTWPDVYKRLIQCSPVIQNKDVWLFDKTPRYMQVLSEVLKKLPGVPCIVIVRDPRAVIWSRIKRSKYKNQLIMRFYARRECKHYLSYAHGYQKAISNGFKNRIFLVQYEALCRNKKLLAKNIFKFLGLEFNESYLDFTNGPKYPNVYGQGVSSQYLTEYRKYLNDDISKEVLDHAKDFREWFWEDEVVL